MASTAEAGSASTETSATSAAPESSQRSNLATSRLVPSGRCGLTGAFALRPATAVSAPGAAPVPTVTPDNSDALDPLQKHNFASTCLAVSNKATVSISSDIYF